MSGREQFLAALLDPDRPPPEGIVTWNGSEPATRFAVYRNNVVSSLINALADTFPVAQELVGEPFFRAMAREYVSHALPRCPVLTLYGESFPRFVEQFPPAASVPYLADVARLELLRMHAYHAADDARDVSEALAQALQDPDALPALTVEFHPAARFLQSPYAVVSLWGAHQGVCDIVAVDPYVSESALITRSHLEVEVIRVTEGESEFLDALWHGASLGAAVERAYTDHLDFDPAGILAVLTHRRAISAFTTTPTWMHT